MTYDETVSLLENLRDVYGNGLPIGENTAALWHQALANQDVTDVMTAAQRWIKDQARAPRPADLLDGCRALRRERLAAIPPVVEDRDRPETDWPARIRESMAASKRELAELGEIEFLRSRGYDPEEYRMSHGMILRRVREKPKARPDVLNPTGAVK